MVLIGITGPTGAGKTTLLREVEALGGAVIDCDAVYHELLEHDPILQHELERRFGPLRGENGSIDRKRLGAIVFGDPEKLAQLNAGGPRQPPWTGPGRWWRSAGGRGEPWPPSTPSHWWRAGWTACVPPPWQSPPRRRCGVRPDHGPGGDPGGLRLVPGAGPEAGGVFPRALRPCSGERLRQRGGIFRPGQGSCSRRSYSRRRRRSEP